MDNEEKNGQNQAEKEQESRKESSFWPNFNSLFLKVRFAY
jgi:hypothetical protein